MRSSLLALILSFAGLAAAAPLPEHTDLLAQNTVLARYLGTRTTPCHFRTMDCPDRCGHAVTTALFEVLANEDYQKPGKYGDDKMEKGEVIAVDAKADTPGQPEEVRAAFGKLTPGETVRMTITHYYLNGERVCEPVRPVTALQTVAPATGEKPALPADPEEKIMPLGD